jgi:hypothetical protein
MMIDMPSDAAGMHKHMAAPEPNGHAAGPMTDMAMPDMVKKHDAMHADGAHHTHPFPTKSVHFVKDAPNLIEGLAIPFGGPLAGKDFDGERFTPATDLCLPWFGDTGRPALYGHGLNAATKTEVVGRQVSLEQRDEGWWIKAELDKRSHYREAIGQLVDKGALSFSSGAMPHLVQATKNGEITRWPWVEISLTPTPANPLAVVYAVKSSDLFDHYAAASITIPDPLAAALKALDEWAAIRDDSLPDGLTYADESARLTDSLKAFVERTQALASMRAKAGRALSGANRDRLATHVDSIGTAMDSMGSAMDAMVSTHADMRALLAAADPATGKALADAVLAEWEYLATSLPR